MLKLISTMTKRRSCVRLLARYVFTKATQDLSHQIFINLQIILEVSLYRRTKNKKSGNCKYVRFELLTAVAVISGM